MVQLAYNPWFNYFIMTVIFLNCVTICFYDHSEKHKRRNEIAESISNWFTIIYIIEAVIKIIADGFIWDKGTYLRNPVNFFDFIIIVASIVRFVLGNNITNKRAISFFRILRTLRVFKLLAGFQKVPQLKKQIITLGRALKSLANVGIFLFFFFMLLAIFGLQLFSEDIFNSCRLTPEPVEIDGKMVWQRSSLGFSASGTNSGICSKKTGWLYHGGFKCPEG